MPKEMGTGDIENVTRIVFEIETFGDVHYPRMNFRFVRDEFITKVTRLVSTIINSIVFYTLWSSIGILNTRRLNIHVGVREVENSFLAIIFMKMLLGFLFGGIEHRNHFLVFLFIDVETSTNFSR